MGQLTLPSGEIRRADCLPGQSGSMSNLTMNISIGKAGRNR
jgi:hypothetical protein